jgi:hypothetical protein
MAVVASLAVFPWRHHHLHHPCVLLAFRFRLYDFSPLAS